MGLRRCCLAVLARSGRNSRVSRTRADHDHCAQENLCDSGQNGHEFLFQGDNPSKHPAKFARITLLYLRRNRKRE